jgi:hypothetical protein
MTRKEKRELIYKKYNGHCAYCGCELQNGWHVNELLPVKRLRNYKKDENGDRIIIMEVLDKKIPDKPIPEDEPCSIYGGDCTFHCKKLYKELLENITPKEFNEIWKKHFSTK